MGNYMWHCQTNKDLKLLIKDKECPSEDSVNNIFYKEIFYFVEEYKTFEVMIDGVETCSTKQRKHAKIWDIEL